jgi:nucleoside 2-deoxyribosyltransferase
MSGRGRGGDWSQHPEAKAFLARAARDLPRLMGDSAVLVSLLPTGETDPKFAVELGYMILMDKPIVAVVRPGAKVPPKLAMIADHIVEWNDDDPQALARRLAEIVKDNS